MNSYPVLTKKQANALRSSDSHLKERNKPGCVGLDPKRTSLHNDATYVEWQKR